MKNVHRQNASSTRASNKFTNLDLNQLRIHRLTSVLSLLFLCVVFDSAYADSRSSEQHWQRGYEHHDDHSGRYNFQKMRWEWDGKHKGCNVQGKHHHHDHDDDVLTCEDAYASPESLWPANHRFERIEIEGISSGHSEAEVVIQCVYQDEPLNGQGDGNTEIDAKFSSSGDLFLRKERSGQGNGRVYNIDFIATHEHTGESCEGTVAVDVPHRKNGQALDDGRLYQSLDTGFACGGDTNTPPEITSDPVTTATETVSYEYTVVAEDADGDSLGYSLASSPDAMSIDSDGLIQWLPAEGDAGVHPVTVLVDDGEGGTAEQSFQIDVSIRPNNAPVITSSPPTQATEEQLYSYQLVASDGDGDAITYSLIAAPGTMSISDTGLVQWTPVEGDAGGHPVIIQAVDTQGATVCPPPTATMRWATEQASSTPMPVLSPIATTSSTVSPTLAIPAGWAICCSAIAIPSIQRAGARKSPKRMAESQTTAMTCFIA